MGCHNRCVRWTALGPAVASRRLILRALERSYGDYAWFCIVVNTRGKMTDQRHWFKGDAMSLATELLTKTGSFPSALYSLKGSYLIDHFDGHTKSRKETRHIKDCDCFYITVLANYSEFDCLFSSYVRARMAVPKARRKPMATVWNPLRPSLRDGCFLLSLSIWGPTAGDVRSGRHLTSPPALAVSSGILNRRRRKKGSRLSLNDGITSLDVVCTETCVGNYRDRCPWKANLFYYQGASRMFAGDRHQLSRHFFSTDIIV